MKQRWFCNVVYNAYLPIDINYYCIKILQEIPFAGLFRDLRNQTTFEASGISNVRGQFYVVFDSSMSLGSLDDEFHFRGSNNVLIGDKEKESQFEGIAYVSFSWNLFVLGVEVCGLFFDDVMVY